MLYSDPVPVPVPATHKPGEVLKVQVVKGRGDWLKIAAIVVALLLPFTVTLLLGSSGSGGPIEDWLDERFQLIDDDGADDGVTRIGLVDLSGIILSADMPSGIDSLSEEPVITPDLVREELFGFVDDERIDAILLRVSTPGGMVSASDEIEHIVALANAEKPVYVYSSDVLASGGYYFSAAAEKIFAHRHAIVGSIGVIAQIANVEKLMEETLGIQMETYKAGKFKDTEDPYRSRTPEEQALIQADVDEAYEDFIDVVARDRGMPKERVRELATGQVWTGQRALEEKLIDGVLYQEELADRLRSELDTDDEIRFLSYYWPPSLLDSLLSVMHPTVAMPSLLSSVDQMTRILPGGPYYLYRR